MQEEKVKIFRIKLKPRELDLIIFALAEYLKQNFEILLKTHEHSNQMIFFQRLVRTSYGYKGRPDEWGARFWQMPTRKEFENRIRKIMGSKIDPLLTSKRDL